MAENWKLTDREIEVLKLLISGFSNSQIAKTLNITTHTVKAHIAALYLKTKIHSRVVLAIQAYKAGIRKN